jgi:hypothetical protein
MRLRLGLSCALFLAAAGTALAAAGDPTLKATPAGQTAAHRVVLKAPELPGSGWKGSPVDFTQPNPACLIKNYNLSDLTLTGRAGTDFQRGSDLIETEAAVFQSRAQAATAWKRTNTQGYLNCTAAFLARSLQIPGATASVESAAFRTIPRVGDASSALGITVKLSSGARTLRVVVDVASARKGPVEADLAFFTLGSATYRPAEVALLRRMVQRIAG